MFQHFGNRLKRDIKQIVDRRLEASAVASGSALRVRLLLAMRLFVFKRLIMSYIVLWC
jgi:hypothetical protein